MSKGKLEKFAEFDAFPNTWDANNSAQNRGKWAELVFKNNYPIVLELACGKGDYSLGLAKMHTDKNFIGIDIKGNRLWKGAKTALESSLPNVHFLRIQIDTIAAYFEPGEIDEIWITFPDPQPSKERKRLTSPKFLAFYRQVAKPDAYVNLKTDSDLFYESTLEVIAEQKLGIEENYPNVYSLSEVPEKLQLKTYYENMWLLMGRTIKYIRFQLMNIT
jgi:tRNA (guanine-N7-)-methyltransferase